MNKKYQRMSSNKSGFGRNTGTQNLLADYEKQYMEEIGENQDCDENEETLFERSPDKYVLKTEGKN